ncbi:protein phosphatase 2c, putative [Perkinsus marinus ATCC 50983]|uniref:Protein phosphatase 2c, putative n=1 Tax=Perkinsus marinus (strain ATCC 50983 / TXsc) TaxID=423536 RepID=C5LBJ8_PERM5|nr:protein phosphatase 2c, putative [Perkinsus marinus ATCC 50983]EER05819.1 protein phosphatase 2c, putative [Perkinsus marinus ATCC 50983]|eukprot:XP_002774003.1 protein phosphatase 2c, putative [Perkinsus marinus ATCC 50983]
MPLSDSSVHPSQDLPGLAMSRAFGDTIAASAGVIAEPEISKHDTSNKDKFIVIASDGVWDFMSNEEVVHTVAKYYNQESSRKAARAVVKEASERWESNEDVVDDITCVVVFLQGK